MIFSDESPEFLEALISDDFQPSHFAILAETFKLKVVIFNTNGSVEVFGSMKDTASPSMLLAHQNGLYAPVKTFV